MKKILSYIIFLSFIFIFFSCQQKVELQQLNKGVNILLPDGTLGIYPLSDRTVRIKFFNSEKNKLPELVVTSEYETPAFKVEKLNKSIRVVLSEMYVDFDKNSYILTFCDSDGNVFLSEKLDSRVFKADSVMGEESYFIEQSFNSPDDEMIFGLGQFQDGNYNLKGISRRLTQVNSQISIPFIYSNKGYGLLWHQYGLTDFNPADNFITLEKQQSTNDNDDDVFADVTTTEGTRKVSQNQNFYTGSFNIKEDGEYSIFLDLGDMGNLHYVVVDDKVIIDQRNMWLPPTAGTSLFLEKGDHEVQLLCKADNEPTLSWKLCENDFTFRSPNAKLMDYIVFYGPEADSVIADYRQLTGNAPLFPKWAYGFWQCRERYTSANHLVETVKEFRERELPLDVIVQDWQYWGDKGWGVPEFDEQNYPNPPKFIKGIHNLNAHLCVSIWSNPDKNSLLGQKYVANNRFIPNTQWLDYFNPDTRTDYWNTLKENMFDYGVDSWWMDAVEPENDALVGTNTFLGSGYFYRLVYPLMVSQSVYEGQRNATDEKRVCILTRSAFSGQQRYGVINWSGDVGSSWDEYKRQIIAGLNFTITGLPYWTTDIGGFFRPGVSQYTDKSYHEILTRWFQWGTFNPIFRVHGYMSETEPWKYGQEVEDNMRRMLQLRYRLLPYIYSEAWQVTDNGSTMMRPLVMDFREDAETITKPYQYMFGKSILVAPVTEAGIDEMEVYLPDASGWFDFWTGEVYDGKQNLVTDVTLQDLPLYVKAGSIIPMGDFIQYTGEKSSNVIELRIYDGADGSFVLYEDEGDGYDYEKGSYSTIKFLWDNASRILTIADLEGDFLGRPDAYIFKIVLVSEIKGGGIEKTEMIDREVVYNGEKLNIKLN
ncbi:MAG: DUF5110 domain-containing protein [Clostridium sp.]|nr:DUF5110 domain-containing protein [Clostridium sp.]